MCSRACRLRPSRPSMTSFRLLEAFFWKRSNIDWNVRTSLTRTVSSAFARSDLPRTRPRELLVDRETGERVRLAAGQGLGEPGGRIGRVVAGAGRGARVL